VNERRRLGGLAFLALAGVLAWGGTVDTAQAWIRWPVVVLLGCFGVIVLFSDRVRWLRERDQIEGAYLLMIMLGLAIAAVAWLVPSSGSKGLLAVGGLLVIIPLSLWILARLRMGDDDPNRPR
jgi:multisubunit Na+/H+ antiporter MnhG subunit